MKAVREGGMAGGDRGERGWRWEREGWKDEGGVKEGKERE